MPDIAWIPSTLITFVITLLATLAATPFVAKTMRRAGITGKDVHKTSEVKVPEMGGLAIMFALTVTSISVLILFPGFTQETVAFLGTILIAGGIGIIDDLRPLGARTKPLLTAAACIPILALRTFDPYPFIPLFGSVSLTLVYPLLVPLAIAVTSNAVNMMDVMNGSMPGTAAIVAAAATLLLLLLGRLDSALLAAGLLAAMIGFYYFNRFPAKVFGGDTGSLTVGATLGALAILGRIETFMIVALIPQIMNAFYGLASVGGLRERRQIHERPVRLLNNGLIEANSRKDAPVTLARLILAAGPLNERGVVRVMMALTAVSSLLALLTYWIAMVVKP